MQAIEKIRREALRALAPPPKINLANWIEEKIVLPETVSAVSGNLRLWQYQRGICDAIEDPSIERISIIKAVRIGYSTLLTATLAHFVANDPAMILTILPTEADCRNYTTSDIEPIFESSPDLRGLLSPENDPSGRSTLLSRRFSGGSLKIIPARSPRNLRAHTARILLADEIDAWEITAEGDALALAERRTISFANRKIVAGSTPIFDHGAISRLYAQSDRRVFEVPCPECREFTEVLWSNICWDDGKPETAAFTCPHCGSIVSERHKPAMVASGRWRATAPEVKGHAGFRLNALISPHKNASWGKLAAEFINAKNNPDTLQVFANTILGQPWRDAAEELDENELAARAEDWGLGNIPADVLFLTAGVDVQRDRLEILILGHDASGTIFILGARTLWGPPDEKSVWAELDDFLKATWPHPNGGTLRIDACGVDAGDGVTTDAVLNFCRPRFAHRVIAVKGASGNRPHIQASTQKGSRLFIVGVDGLKSLLFNRLSRGNSIRFSRSLEPRIFEEIASERAQVRYVRGAPVRQWVRIPGRAAEALDCTVYAVAVRGMINADPERRATELASAGAISQPRPLIIRSAWLDGSR